MSCGGTPVAYCIDKRCLLECVPSSENVREPCYVGALSQVAELGAIFDNGKIIAACVMHVMSSGDCACANAENLTLGGFKIDDGDICSLDALGIPIRVEPCAKADLNVIKDLKC